DAVVEGDDAVALLAGVREARTEPPRTLRPAVRLGGRHLAGEVHPAQPGEGARGGDRRRLVDRVARLRGGDEAAALRTRLAQAPHELARVDAGDGRNAFAPQVVAQRLDAAPVRQPCGHVLDDQPGG